MKEIFFTIKEFVTEHPFLSAIIFLVIGFAIGTIKKWFTGELSLTEERRLEANRLRAARAIRQMEKANRKILRARQKVEMAKQVGSIRQIAGVRRDVKNAIPAARYAHTHIKAVLQKAQRLSFSIEVVQELEQRKSDIQKLLDSEKELLDSISVAEKTVRKQGALSTAVPALDEAISILQVALNQSESCLGQAKRILETAWAELHQFEERFRQEADSTIYHSGGILRNPFKLWDEAEGDDTITVLHLRDSKSDLQRVESAIASVDLSLRQIRVVIDLKIVNIECFENMLGKLESALNSVDNAIGDSDMPLPRELVARHSALFDASDSEPQDGALDKLQQALETLENNIYLLENHCR